MVGVGKVITILITKSRVKFAISWLETFVHNKQYQKVFLPECTGTFSLTGEYLRKHCFLFDGLLYK